MARVTYPLDEAQSRHRRRLITSASGVLLSLLILTGAFQYLDLQNDISPVLTEKEARVLAERDHREAQDSIAQTVEDLELKVTALENQLVSAVTHSYPISAPSVGTNLIRNSSFESAEGGKPRQWTYMYDSTAANTAQSNEGIRSGAYGLKFAGAASGSTTTSIAYGGLDLGVSQPETETVPGRTYTFSLYVKHTNIKGEAYVRLGFWDKYNNRFGPMKTIPITETRDWYRLSTTVETTGLITDHANWYPMIEVRRLGEGEAVYLEDVQLEEGNVMSLYNTAQAGTSSLTIGGALGDGSILATTTGTLYPASDGVGSLGTSSNRWHDLYLSKATINENGDLDLTGTASVGNLTVNGSSTLKGTVTIDGTPTFSALSSFKGGITVGENGQFSINAQGDITKIKGVAYSFPSAQGAASSVLMNDGAGALSWGTFGAASVTPDSLDFAQFVDGMTLDADSSINLNNNGTPQDLRFYNSNTGTEMLYLDGATGRIGIGTTAPGAKLDVTGIAQAQGITINVASWYPLLDILDGSTQIAKLGDAAAGGNIGYLSLYSAGTETVRLRSDNNISYINTTANFGLGTASPASKLDVHGTTWLRGVAGGTSGLFVNSSGYVGIGTTNPGNQLSIVDNEAIYLNLEAYSDTGSSDSVLVLRKARGTDSSPAAVANGDDLGGLFIQGYSGSSGVFRTGAKIQFLVDGEPDTAGDTTDMPGRIEFMTTPDGSSTALTRMTIKNDGNLGIGTTAPVSTLDVAGTSWLRGASGGTSGLYVNSSGNVGIGTTAPGYKLEVSGGDIRLGSGSTSYRTYFGTTTTAYWDPGLGTIYLDSGVKNTYIDANATLSTLDLNATGGIQLKEGDVSRFMLGPNGGISIGNTYVSTDPGANNVIIEGSVGIGTSAPQAALVVSRNMGKLMQLYGNSNNLIDFSSSGSITHTYNTTDSRYVLSSNASIDLGLPSSEGAIGLGKEAIKGIIQGTSLGGLTFFTGGSTVPVVSVNSSGNVGIGTTAPGQKLDVALGNISLDNDYVIGWGNGGESVTGSSNTHHLRFNVNSSEKVRLDSSGNVGIGTTAPGYKLQVGMAGDGSEARANAWNTLSDERLKENINLFTDPLGVIDQMQGVRFTWKGTGEESMGFIAQDLEQVLPEVVSTGADGYKSVNYPVMNALLAEGIKELNRKVDTLPSTTAIDALAIDSELASVKDRLSTLEKRLGEDDQDEQLASVSATLATLKSDVEMLKSTQFTASVSAALADVDLPIAEDETTLPNLIVTGHSNVYNLAVTGRITSGLLAIDGLTCADDDNCAATVSTFSGPLKIQDLAAGAVEIMAGKVVIDTNGDMKVDGTLTVQEVKADTVTTKNLELGNDVVFTSGATAPTGGCQTGAVYVWNDKTKDEARMYVCTKKAWNEVGSQ